MTTSQKYQRPWPKTPSITAKNQKFHIFRSKLLSRAYISKNSDKTMRRRASNYKQIVSLTHFKKKQKENKFVQVNNSVNTNKNLISIFFSPQNRALQSQSHKSLLNETKSQKKMQMINWPSKYLAKFTLSLASVNSRPIWKRLNFHFILYIFIYKYISLCFFVCVFLCLCVCIWINREQRWGYRLIENPRVFRRVILHKIGLRLINLCTIS